MQHIDAAGKAITPGAYFVYATRIADRSHLQFGRVLVLNTKDRWGDPRAKIGAITVQRAWLNDAWEPTGKGRVQTIERLDACLVVSKSQLAADILAAIEPAFKTAKAKLPKTTKPSQPTSVDTLEPSDITYGG